MDVASVRRVHQEDWTDEGVRFLRARDLVAFAKNESIEDPLFISSEMYKEYSAQSGKVSVGDLLVTGVGTIGVPWLVTSDNPVYFKDGNIIWFKNRHSIDGGFFYHSFTASAIQNYIDEAAGIGTVGTYTIETGKKTPIWLPSRQEQREIAAMMTHLDTLITLHQRKYDKLCTVKKSMLDKMFPKPGETEPEIRFEGFTDPWEQRKLGDLISVYIAHAGPEEDVTVLTSSRDGIQKQEDHFGRLQQHDTSDWNLIPYGYCTYRNRSDDGLFTFNVNKVADRGIVSKFYPVFETPECDADFLVAYLNSSQEIRKKLFVLAVGTSQVVLSYGALKELSLLLPQNREQSAIANVLNHIDNLITLHQREFSLPSCGIPVPLVPSIRRESPCMHYRGE